MLLQERGGGLYPESPNSGKRPTATETRIWPSDEVARQMDGKRYQAQGTGHRPVAENAQ